jgi:hypothetical protein
MYGRFGASTFSFILLFIMSRKLRNGNIAANNIFESFTDYLFAMDTR